MSSRYFLPEVLETNNQLSVTESPTDSAFVTNGQKFVILDGLIDTDNYSTAERTFDLNTGSPFTDTIVHLRYSLNGASVNSFSPSGLDNFYVVDSADTSYNPLSDIGSAIADDGGVLTDETAVSQSSSTDDMTLLPSSPAINDAYYFGHGTAFSKLTLNISTALVEESGGSITLVWEYYNGSTWSAIPTGTLVDGTTQLSVSGTNNVTFPRPNDWAKTTIGVSGEVEAYYIRIRVSAFSDITTVPIGEQAWTGTAEAHFESLTDDLFIARIVVNVSDEVTSITSIANPSKLIVQKGLFEDSLTRNILTDNDITNNTQTINQGESGAGVTAGTAGFIIDRGSLANYEIRFDESDDMLKAGLVGSLTPIVRFDSNTPADGRLVFTDQSGTAPNTDEVSVGSLYWDKTNTRLGIGVSTPLDALDIVGEIRISLGFHSGIDTAHLDFNVDASGKAIQSGSHYATQLIGLSAGGFKLRTANALITAGSLVTWREVFEANASGEVGVGVTPISGQVLTLNGDLTLKANTAKITATNAGAAPGLELSIGNSGGSTDTLFRIRDSAQTKNNLIIKENAEWVIDSPLVSILENAAVTDAEFQVGSVNGLAKISLDGNLGLFGNSSHAEIYHNSTTKLFITTLSSGGDVIISPILNGGVAGGNVGIGDPAMTTAHKLDVMGKIQSRQSVADFILFETGGNNAWHMYQPSDKNFYIGEDNTTANAALSIVTSTRNIAFGTNFKWDRANSRLGINQATPLYPLHIESGTATQIFAKGIAVDGVIEIDNDTAANDSILLFSNAGADKWKLTGSGAGTKNLIITNVVDSNSAAMTITGGSGVTANDIVFDGNMFYDVSEVQLVIPVSTVLTDVSMTYGDGSLRLDGNTIDGTADGGLEFRSGITNSGSGARIFVTRVDENNSDLVFAGRIDSDNAWQQTLSIRRNNLNETLININDIPTHIDDSDAATLTTGDIYQTSTGELRIKL